MEKKTIVCESCFNKDICKYSEKAVELSKKIKAIIEEETGLCADNPIIFGLSVTCPKFTRSSFREGKII